MISWLPEIKSLFYGLVLVFQYGNCQTSFLIKHTNGNEVREDLNVMSFEAFVHKNVVFSRGCGPYQIKVGNDSLYYKGCSLTESYTLQIRNPHTLESYDISQKSGEIYKFQLVFLKTSNLRISTTYNFYPNGLQEAHYSQVSIKAPITGYRTLIVETAKAANFDKNGNLIFSLDYDKEFSWSLNKLLEFYEKKIKEPIWRISRRYYRTAEDFQGMQKVTRNYSYKPSYPYYEIVSSQKDSINSQLRIFDGKTGKLILATSLHITSIE